MVETNFLWWHQLEAIEMHLKRTRQQNDDFVKRPSMFTKLNRSPFSQKDGEVHSTLGTIQTHPLKNKQ